MEEETRRKPNYIYFQTGGGLVQNESERGGIGYGKFGFEYRILPFIGLGIGASLSNQRTVDNPKGLSDLLLVGAIINSNPTRTSTSNNNSSSNSNVETIFNFFIINFFLTQTIFTYQYSSLHFDVNFHLNKDNFFDPYIGIGLITGSCFGSISCRIEGGEVRTGIQFNFENNFIYTQIQTQKISIIYEFDSSTYPNFMASIGAGVRFK